jgi:uncharacterized protein YndB with AHSA1/START domain
MDTTPFVIERVYHAPVQAVWEALTDPAKMKEWYFDIADFRAEPGFEFRFYGGDETTQYLHICTITDVIPFKKLRHTWTYEHIANVSYVTFELFEEGENTRVKLTHEGLEGFAGNGPSFARESFAAGWTDIIGRLLKEYVEK